MRRLAVLACLVAGALSASPARAGDAQPATGDEVVVTLMSGATLRGTLTEQNQGGVTLRLPDGTSQRLNYDTFNGLRRDEEAMAKAAAAKAAQAGPPKVGPPAIGDEVVVALMSGKSVRGTLVGKDHWYLKVRVQDGTELAGIVQDVPLWAVNGLRHAGAVPDQPVETTPRPPAHVGLGVALPSAGDFPSFYLPVQATPSLRVEPEVGLVRLQVAGASATAFQLGLGLLGTRSVAPQVGAYAGVRLQLQRLNPSGAEGTTNLRVAGVMGGEWLPVPQVSLGVEVQAAYLSVDQPDGASGPASGLSTAGLLFLRIYLN